MEEKDLEKYIDSRMKKYLFEIRDEVDELSKKVADTTELHKKNIDQIREKYENLQKKEECSKELKELIVSDASEREERLLDEIEKVLPRLMSVSANTKYIWIAILVILILQVLLFIKPI